MRVLSLWQPWASLIALNLKQFETRSWGTDYRGKLLIHATRSQPVCVAGMLECIAMDMEPDQLHLISSKLPLPQGCVVAMIDLTHCFQMTGHEDISPLETACGDWECGRYAWKLENVLALPNPIPWKGAQGLRNAPPELVELVKQAFNPPV